jgi:sec-independent protein translocase protein TatB
MPSFPDSIFLFVLALLLFGPKRLPVLARELGKWVGEFRRASNEFKMQMEDELRLSEQAERNKQIAAMEAASPARTAGVLEPTVAEASSVVVEGSVAEAGVGDTGLVGTQVSEARAGAPGEVAVETPVVEVAAPSYEVVDGVKTPLPIAVSGELKIMPPKTGLPVVATTSGPRNSGLKALLDAIPAAETAGETTESGAHGN